MSDSPLAVSAAAREPTWRVLGDGSFPLFVASRVCSGAAIMMLRAAVSWQIYDISRSAFHLGMVGFVQFLPALLLSLVGGAAADVYDRKRLVIAAQTIPMLLAPPLFLGSRLELIRLPHLYALVIAFAICSAFENPARAALLPLVVSRPRFSAAVTVHTALQMGAFLSGPVLMGFLVARYGIAAPYAVYAALMALSIVLMTRVHPDRSRQRRGVIRFQAIREGLAYVRRQPVVLGCMVLDMFAVLFGGAVAMLPIYATDILQVGARGYGLLASSLEIGAVLMAITMIALPPVKNTGRALILAVVGFGLATVVFGLSRSFPLSLAAYMMAGMSDYVSMVMRGTAIQLTTPDELRGRVSAVNSVFIGASNQLGAAESGFVAALTTPTFSVVSGGLAALAVVLLVTVLNPTLRRYRAEDSGPPSRNPT